MPINSPNIELFDQALLQVLETNNTRFGLTAQALGTFCRAYGFQPEEKETLDRLEGEGRVMFRYQGNPNGSARDIAGIVSEKRNVLGLMPHPERVVDPVTGGTDGRALFESLIETLS